MRQREQEEKDIERRVRLEENVRDRIREERRRGDKRRRLDDDHDYSHHVYNQNYHDGYNHDHRY